MALTTSSVAREAGVNLDTVRYYEKRGLLPEPDRTPSGYRQYGPEHVQHIRFIKRAQELGFSLEDIRELLELRVTPGAGKEVRARTTEKIREIEAKISDLERIRDKLHELSEACLHGGSPDSCLVLHALDHPHGEHS